MEQQFIILCRNGNLDEAKEFLTLNPYINISIYSEEVFRQACSGGHLELAKWLLSVKPDINISIKNEYAFHWACLQGHLEIAKWFQSLKPYVYLFEFDECGFCGLNFKIRSKEEANWERRKYALHLALQEELNILYHLPVDIVKAVTLFV